ncbi:UDP-glucose 4-epimerase GalE [Oenococcus oeni]|uniref:UDP-glucose 4-epimerase n=2 Tax=Oenococcus oeni TaxID=1247 RepID=A0A6N4A0W6_OENOE|nr:UDP-glucose 4-epimerase GalE [Oenococcus oeni]MDV7686717.1 UDP-glucose 4-epimerase GalE [Oenococcus oeni]OIM20820.1 UDP-glucose 4-epimerase GalE [Oenococcus oeni]OIM24074.1 UDP-glucose 4-epimerase GalE [Oenococcus oeni]SYW08810.1 UDP-glucose 4-epimerase [Oenococcus oeni]SYW11318.1 UDP-glucose 4-epimerase [Oenococcus oeni]
MNVLVTGGAGYIGSHTVDRLLAHGDQVSVVDNLWTGHRQAVPDQAKFYEADVRDKAALKKIFDENDFDAVVHFAALTQVGESMKKPLFYFDNNTFGVISLLEAMRDHDVKKIVFSSSAATYGVPKHNPITEDEIQKPINPYGLTKLQMEQIMAWSDQAYGIKGVALRYFNVAGAKADGSIGEDHNPETHMIPNILMVAQGKKDKMVIFGDDYNTPDGTNVRDYVHVVDLADAHVLALEYLQRENKSNRFNLGTETGMSNKQLISAAKKVTGIDFKVEIGPRRAGDPDALVASPKKAKEVLGWDPKLSNVEDEIKSAWNWMTKHPNGYDDKEQ